MTSIHRNSTPKQQAEERINNVVVNLSQVATFLQVEKQQLVDGNERPV